MAKPLMTVEDAPRVLCKAGPVAIQNIGIDKGLQFEVARRLEQPVAMCGEAGMIEGSTEDWTCGHGILRFAIPSHALQRL